jgi:hypothetical protein
VNPPPWFSEQWFRWFVTIVLASVLAGAVFFFANWRITANARRAADRDRRAAEREQRISSVVDAYVSIVTAGPPRYAGISALFVAGVRRLDTHHEIADALKRIEERTGQKPLGRPAESISDLHAMLREVTFDGLTATSYGATNLDAVYEKYRKT